MPIEINECSLSALEVKVTLKIAGYVIDDLKGLSTVKQIKMLRYAYPALSLVDAKNIVEYLKEKHYV